MIYRISWAATHGLALQIINSMAVNGDLYAWNDHDSTFFEGRLISKLDE